MNKNDFDVILNINDEDFIEQFKNAIGLKDGEELEIVTPQFEREDGVVPALPSDGWEILRSRSSDTLRILGCRCWDEPDKNNTVLMLFPYQWYPYIPAGYEIEDINGEIESFEPGKTDDDYRGGCLAYGIRVKE